MVKSVTAGVFREASRIFTAPASSPDAAFQPVAAATSNVTTYAPTACGRFVVGFSRPFWMTLAYLTVIAPEDLPDFGVTVTGLVVPEAKV